MRRHEQAGSTRPYHRVVRSRNRFMCALAVAVSCSLGWLGACLDDRLGPFVPPPPPPPAAIVSNPQPGTAVLRSGASLSPGQGTTTEMTYVSLQPGTVSDGGLATIGNSRTGGSVPVAMADGGFDPLPIEARAGDMLTVDVEVAGGGIQSLLLAVPAARPPVVVRTNPPRKKRDVPLNSAIVVVFSEPIRPSSAAGIQLLRASVPVSGRSTVTADGLRAVFQPDDLLASNADYVLSIPTDVADLSGERVQQPVTVEFTTGNTVALASVVTEEAALVMNPLNGALRAFNMSAIMDSGREVTGYFSIFYPEVGTGASGRVTCFTIVDGTAAWVGGIVEASNDPSRVGVEYMWRVADNGQRGGPVADRLSLAHYDPDRPPGDAAQYCATTPIVDQLFDLVGGDIVVSGVTVAPPPPPPPSAGVSQIAYWIDGILIQPADRSPGWPLTAARNDRNPAWSPDARKLAFHSDRAQPGNWDIWVINGDLTGLTRLTTTPERDEYPAWSPDGTKIAFARNGFIYVMNGDGSGVAQLSSGPSHRHPTWSPDGTHIAFSGSPGPIWVINADGSGLTQLTPAGSQDFDPAWSPDGTKIAFGRGLGEPPNSGLHVMNADGSGLTRLTLGINGAPSWSPDSRRILYEWFGMTFVMADGSGMTRFFSGFDPVWSPLGTMPPEPAPFRSVEMVSGDGQAAPVGTTLPQALSVRVVHDDGTPQPGVTIRWNKWGSSAGPGSVLSLGTAITDSDGVASVQLTFGSTPGQVRVRAALVDGTARTAEVVFTATAVPSP